MYINTNFEETFLEVDKIVASIVFLTFFIDILLSEMRGSPVTEIRLRGSF